MNPEKKKIPLGIKDFKELREGNYYYVDKTGLIRELLPQPAKVTLFCRPEKFGRTLTLSMLENFFSPEGDPHLFEGLEIKNETKICDKYMGKVPVISLSLKEMKGENFEEAYKEAVRIITETAARFSYLLESENLSELFKGFYRRLFNDSMNQAVLTSSLERLTVLLEMHWGKRVIVLIDDYDVPIIAAREKGYDREMSSLISSLLDKVLKTNFSLEFGILTGTLPLQREEVIGRVNLEVRTVTGTGYDSCFGFTDREVEDLLTYFGLEAAYEGMKYWYKGYRIGNSELYCPLDVLGHCSALLSDPQAKPKNYWIDSAYDLPGRLIRNPEYRFTLWDTEDLIWGRPLPKRIRYDLTHHNIFTDADHIWTALYMCGFLTTWEEVNRDDVRFAIPSREVYSAFVKTAKDYFTDCLREEPDRCDGFFHALRNGDREEAGNIFHHFMCCAIAWDHGENLCRQALTLMVEENGSWEMISGEEKPTTLLLISRQETTAVAIGLLNAPNGDWEAAAKKALEQTDLTPFRDILEDRKITAVRRYGISCCGKGFHFTG